MSQRLAFTGKQQLSFEAIVDSGPLAGDQVRARAICSLMSTGTENIVYNRLFEAGSHWDLWVSYPFYPGYAWIGEVCETGAEVDGIQVGDRVALRAGHAQEHTATAEQCLLLPADLEPEQAIWFALAKICYSGAMAAEYQLGAEVLIIGGGPIGQMTCRWASCAGAGRIVMVEPLPLRQTAARRGGAHAVIGKCLEDAEKEILAAFDGRCPTIVIDGTGNAQVFESCLRICADRGRVVILGDTGTPTAQHLTKDVITRRISVVGAHDCHFDNEPPVKLFWSLLQDGRFSVDGLNTHSFDFKDARQAYTLANTNRSETLGIVFRY